MIGIHPRKRIGTLLTTNIRSARLITGAGLAPLPGVSLSRWDKLVVPLL
jgi:hypothetical protein